MTYNITFARKSLGRSGSIKKRAPARALLGDLWDAWEERGVWAALDDVITDTPELFGT
jgi:hypothetical protein